MKVSTLIPSDLLDTVDRLENWGRWARERDGRYGPAIGSAERHYRPRAGDTLSDLPPPRIPVDGFDAQVVGKCLAPAGGFPHRWYVMLKWVYYYRAGRPAVVRKMAIHKDNYQQELTRALYAAKNALAQRNGSPRGMD